MTKHISTVEHVFQDKLFASFEKSCLQLQVKTKTISHHFLSLVTTCAKSLSKTERLNSLLSSFLLSSFLLSSFLLQKTIFSVDLEIDTETREPEVRNAAGKPCD